MRVHGEQVPAVVPERGGPTAHCPFHLRHVRGLSLALFGLRQKIADRVRTSTAIRNSSRSSLPLSRRAFSRLRSKISCVTATLLRPFARRAHARVFHRVSCNRPQASPPQQGRHAPPRASTAARATPPPRRPSIPSLFLAEQNTCRALFASRPLLYLIAFPGAVLYLVPETDAVALAQVSAITYDSLWKDLVGLHSLQSHMNM